MEIKNNSVIEILNQKQADYVKGFFFGSLNNKKMPYFETEFPIYYGLINNKYGRYQLREVLKHKADVISLREEPKTNVFPRVMMVSDDGEKWEKGVVVDSNFMGFRKILFAKTLYEAKKMGIDKCYIHTYKYGKETQEITVTAEMIRNKYDQIAALFGITEGYEMVFDFKE